MLQDLKAAASKAVGTKQTIRAIKENKAAVVYLASDVDDHLAKMVTEECKLADVKLVTVDSMAVLGEACEIQVGAATAAILK